MRRGKKCSVFRVQCSDQKGGGKAAVDSESWMVDRREREGMANFLIVLSLTPIQNPYFYLAETINRTQNTERGSVLCASGACVLCSDRKRIEKLIPYPVSSFLLLPSLLPEHGTLNTEHLPTPLGKGVGRW